MIPLPPEFLNRPLAHRGLHDRSQDVQENSPKAFLRAIEKGYGIEFDVQLSSDGQAMVFHDYVLSRLTESHGRIRSHTAAELGAIALKYGGEPIPTLKDVLKLVDGRTPLLIEIKDQDGMLGKNIGELEQETTRLLSTYVGPVAVMSLNPHTMFALHQMAPKFPRGLVNCDFTHGSNWDYLPDDRRAKLTAIPDFDRVGAAFITHDHHDLDRPRVAEIKASGASILCWTIRSKSEEIEARKIADNITFEGYFP